MIVHNLNVMRPICLSRKADSILVVDSNAVLPLPVVLQRFQPVSRGDTKVFQFGSGFDHVQLPERDRADRLPAFIRASFEESLCIAVCEALDHE